MISEVSISNYKSILYRQFSFSRVNVFVGPDDSGKTNIFEAVGMAAAAHDDALDIDSLQSRGIRAVKPSLTFHSSPQHESCKEIEIIWQEKHSRKKAKLVCDSADDIGASWKDISWFEPDYIAKVNDLIKFIGNGLTNEQYPFADESKNAVLNAAFRGSRNFRDYLIFDLKADALRGISNESQKKPLGISGEGLQKLLSSFTEEQKQEIKSYFPDTNLPDSSSDSDLCALFYLALLMNKNTPTYCAIDNFDGLLDPALYSKMMTAFTQLAVKNNKYVLIATKNQNFANSLNLADPELKLFRVKSENGQTIVEEENS